ncbi:hypothetical protein [Saccharopolyspora gregorii]|nr:hypothetical protein [Saccharopolyspora gregorii]
MWDVRPKLSRIRSTAVADVEIGAHRTMIPSLAGSDNNSIK